MFYCYYLERIGLDDPLNDNTLDLMFTMMSQLYCVEEYYSL
jgi:hypothetical protein